MSAAEALARIGTAGLGEEANEFRAQIRRWISASVPPGLADMAQRNMPGMRREEHASAMASPEYREWAQQLLDAQLICPSWPAAYGRDQNKYRDKPRVVVIRNGGWLTASGRAVCPKR